jgi:LPXTG-motif cell wall-anchored protein
VIVLSIIGGILVLALLAGGGYLFWKKKRDERILADLRANASNTSSLVDNQQTGKNNINTIMTN